MIRQKENFRIPMASVVKTLIYCVSVFFLFLIVHLTTDNINRLLRRASRSPIFGFVGSYSDFIWSYAPSIKTVIFICALVVLCLPVLMDVYRTLKEAKLSNIAINVLLAFITSLLVALFVYRPGTDSMGTNYAIIANSPFTQKSSYYSTKLLMPAIAYFLSLRDFTPYYIFSAILTIIFVTLLYVWAKENTLLKSWQIISLCTCSFVIYQYQYGGYPDILVYIFFILVMQIFIKSESKLLLLVLAILTHESSILIGMILAWRYLNKKHLILYLLVVISYFFVWFLATGGNINAISASRNVGGMSGLEWVVLAPLKETLGILVAYKAVWLAIFLSVWISIRRQTHKDSIFIMACVSAGIFMTFLGIDTSRLMGFSFPGILVALSILSRQLEPVKANKTLSMIFITNLILPSFYIGLNGGMEFFPGLYKYVYGWMTILVK